MSLKNQIMKLLDSIIDAQEQISSIVELERRVTSNELFQNGDYNLTTNVKNLIS